MGRIYIHPDYKTDQAYHDLAIVKVFHVDYSNTITPICLPAKPDPSGSSLAGKSVLVAGWGSFNFSNVASETLKTASLTVLPSRQVFKSKNYHIRVATQKYVHRCNLKENSKTYVTE